MIRSLLFPVLCISLASPLFAGDWMRFRGNDGNSMALSADLPTSWDEDNNIAWQAELPGRGPSSPIVVNGRIFVTSSSGIRQDRLHVLCFDEKSGKKIWERQMWANGRTMTHEASANAAPTPASDGEHVYAFYSSNDLICYDLDGNLKWYRGLGYDFPKAGNDIGMASSPVVASETVVVQVENQGDSFAAGIDTNTGETRWRIERVKQSNWSSPTLTKSKDGRDVVLLKSSEGLTARDIVTGEELWSFKASAGNVPSILAIGDLVYLPADQLTVLKVGETPDPEVKWASTRVRPGSASPIAHNNEVYAIGSSILTCADGETGDVKWKLRLKGDFWATPILTNDYLYCISLDGVAQVVKLGEKGKVAATSEFGETIQGSPAVANNAMFVRSDKHLWKIAATR